MSKKPKRGKAAIAAHERVDTERETAKRAPDPNETLEADIETLKYLEREAARRIEKRRQAQPSIDPNGQIVAPDCGLMAFVRYFWDVLEPETPLVEGWPMHAICQHLEAVTLGKVTRLLINVPPGFSKTLLTQIFWPAWEWSAMDMPHLRYVAFSYSGGITEDRNVKFRTLVQSEKFQQLWGDKFQLEKVGEIRLTNNKTGSKFASSVTGIGTGERGDRIILDDPHSVKQAESDIVRADTVQWFRETMTTRLNDAEKSAIVIIMQRVHQADVSGYILENSLDYCHLMVPMRFEMGREPYNTLGWVDPREEDGDLAWPERFPLTTVERDEALLGSFATAGQFQQRPAPRGGGIIEYGYWQEYSPENAAARFGAKWPAYPPMGFTILSVDTAQTEKKINDPSAAVLLGVAQDIINQRNQVILMHAWNARLEFFDLCNKVEETCRNFRVNKVIIEDKASGIPLAQELRRRGKVFSEKLAHHGKPEIRERADFGVQTVSPEGDKLSRLYAVQNLFEAGVIWAPCDDRGLFKVWADAVQKQCAEMPKGQHDDLADATTMGLLFLRKLGLALMPDDFQFADEDARQYRRPEKPLYPTFA